MRTYKEIVKYRFEMDKKFTFLSKEKLQLWRSDTCFTSGLKSLIRFVSYELFLYACVVWSPYTKRNITNLEQIERRATRIIFGEEYTEYERLSKLNLLPLQ